VARLILVLAVLLHLSAGVLYLGAGLLAPDEAVLVLRAVWLVLLVALVLLWRRRPSAALVVPPVAVVVFLASVTAGEQLLGWTA
jgi:hypothetical protein